MNRRTALLMLASALLAALLSCSPTAVATALQQEDGRNWASAPLH